MSTSLPDQFQQRLSGLDVRLPEHVSRIVEALLSAAREAGASDVHLLPDADSLRMSWRLDGVLHSVASFPNEIKANVVARLKVLADLLTYRSDVPQEGRIRQSAGGDADSNIEMRVSTFPTLFGEKAVVRLFVASGQFSRLNDLGLPTDIAVALPRLLSETSGLLIVSGPAGSGKTTTLYACLRELVDGESTVSTVHRPPSSAQRRSVVTLEDPVEAVLPGAAQSQINVAAGFDFATGLRSVMRQDPEVIMVGEVRDRLTAETVFQASLTGHLVLTTFHTGSAAETITRLFDIGIEPFQIRSGLRGVLCQRLVRRLCDCSVATDDPAARLGLDVTHVREPAGCANCRGTGYRGRLVLAELLRPDVENLGLAIISGSDTSEIERLAIVSGMVSFSRRACDAVTAGVTSPAEIRRTFGFRGV
jgi:type II secretory ATPase GspE/PulE/Tfp pilus assembly ATPase PilB-like protein